MPNYIDVMDAGASRSVQEERAEAIRDAQESSNIRPPKLSNAVDDQDKEMADAIDEALRAKIQTPSREEHDPHHEVRIGLTWMTVPPSAINVSEVRYNEDVPGLRTTANALIKTGRGQMRIDLQLQFPNEEAINNELRPIIAQFRATPFLPIESHYIYNAVTAKAFNLDPKVIDDLSLKINRTYREYKDIQLKMVEAIQDDMSDQLADKYGSLGAGVQAIESKTPGDLMVEAADLAAMDFGNAAINFRSLQMLKDELHRMATAAQSALDRLRVLKQSLQTAGVPAGSRRPTVPVALHSLEITTVPKERHSLMATLSCIYFIHGPFTPTLRFKNAMGGPTADLDESPYFKSYVISRFLQSESDGKNQETIVTGRRYLGKYRSDQGSSFRFEYPIPRFELVEETDADRSGLNAFIPAEEVGGKALNLTGYDAKGKLFRSLTEAQNIGLDDPSLIVNQVVVVLQNRLAMQPIQGSMYGTVQHLGTLNANVSVLFAAVGDDSSTHDEAAAKIQRIKISTDSVANALGSKSRRNAKVRVWNNVLNLAGVSYVQIDKVRQKTVPGERYSSAVQLDMTEFTVSQDRREQIRLEHPGLKQSLYEEAFRVGIDVVDKHNFGEFSLSKGTVALVGGLNFVQPGASAGLLAGMALWRLMAEDNSPHEFRRWIYGNDDEPGILTGRLIASVYYDNQEIQAKIMSKLRPGHPFPQKTGFSMGREQMSRSDDKGLQKQIVNECLRLARESLDHWKRVKPAKDQYPFTGHTSQDVPGRVDPDVEVIQDSKDIITIESSPAKLVTEIMQIMSQAEESAEFKRLQAFAEWARDNYSVIRDYVEDKMKDIRHINVYPDLNLPTYSEIFFGVSAFLSNNQAVSEGMDKMLVQLYTSRYIGPRTKEKLRLFMPTWRGLGKRPPISQDPQDIARKFTDYVDPDFYYYWDPKDADHDRLADQVETEADSLYAESTNIYNSGDKSAAVRTKVNLADAKRTSSSRAETVGTGIRPAYNSDSDDGSITSNTDVVPGDRNTYPRFIYKNGAVQPTKFVEGYGSGPEFDYAPGSKEVQKTLGKFVHNHPRHIKSLFREAVASQRDDENRMLRAFPTFRLYFIELDNEAWGVWDDFFAYNAVLDIQLSEHKFEPSLLQIKLINVTGNLDRARSSFEDPDKYGQDAKQRNPDGSFKETRVDPSDPSKSDEAGEPRFLNKFYLQTGTPVMLKLGYGGHIDDLENKFTGHIVEHEPGDVTTILCQSYKNELTVPLNTYQDGSDADAWNIIKWVMDNSPTMHFGEWSPYEVGLLNGPLADGSERNLESTERLRYDGTRTDEEAKEAADKALDTGLDFGWAGELGVGTGIDIFGLAGPQALVYGPLTLGSLILTGDTLGEHLESIPEAAISRYNEWKQTRKMSNVYLPRNTGSRGLFSWGREFIIPDRTGLEVLHELTRHMPGYVFDVRPYDHKATMFFGKPEQRYFYTAFKQDEERLWQQLKTEKEAVAQTKFNELIKKFEKSWQYTTLFKTLHEIYHGGGSQVGKALSRAVGRLPGKILSEVTFGLWGGDLEARGARLGQKYIKGFRESPDAVPTVNSVESMVGRLNLKILSCYFFNRYSQYDFADDIINEIADISAQMVSMPLNPLKLLTAPVEVPLDTVEGFYGAGKAVVDKLQESEDTRYDPTLMPGSILSRLTDWRGKVDAISTKNDGSVGFNDDLVYNVFNVSTESHHYEGQGSGVVDAQGRQIEREEYEKAVYSIIDYIPDWKMYATAFKAWLEERIALGDSELIKAAYEAGKEAESYEFNPRTKRFRDVHFVDSARHIIKNNIIATKSQMANTVVIKYPDDVDEEEAGDRYFVPSDIDWNTMEWMVDDNIQPSEKKVRLVTEVNADSDKKAELCAYSNLAQALRPMYRGELHIRGNEKIKPFDIIWMADNYENVYGPIEVERNILRINIQTGFTNTIVPELVTIPMSRSSWMDAQILGVFNAAKTMAKSSLWSMGGMAAGLVSPIPGGSVIGAAAGYIISSQVYGDKLEEETGAGIWGNLTGRGRYGNMLTKVDMIPLIRNGIPWTAGLRGFGDGNWKLRYEKRWSDVKRGASIIWRGFTRKLKGIV
jgi:hypothetical protein